MPHAELILAVRNALKDRRATVIAKATGLNVNTIYYLIRGKGKPQIGTVMLVANYLGIDTKGGTDVISQ